MGAVGLDQQVNKMDKKISQYDIHKGVRKAMPKPTVPFKDRKRKIQDDDHKKQMRDHE